MCIGDHSDHMRVLQPDERGGYVLLAVQRYNAGRVIYVATSAMMFEFETSFLVSFKSLLMVSVN